MPSTRKFELTATASGRGSKLVVNGQDISNMVQGVMVTVTPSEGTQLALMPSAGFAGKILGEGEVLELTDGIPAVEFLDEVDPGELEAEVGQYMSTPEGSVGTVAEAFLAVLRRQAVAANEGEQVD
jgi:hypothetical protein